MKPSLRQDPAFTAEVYAALAPKKPEVGKARQYIEFVLGYSKDRATAVLRKK